MPIVPLTGFFDLASLQRVQAASILSLADKMSSHTCSYCLSLKEVQESVPNICNTNLFSMHSLYLPFQNLNYHSTYLTDDFWTNVICHTKEKTRESKECNECGIPVPNY